MPVTCLLQFLVLIYESIIKFDCINKDVVFVGGVRFYLIDTWLSQVIAFSERMSFTV